MNVFLLGYMGSGKSTIGKSLATYKGMDFIDLDDYIAQQQGMNVPSIFSKKGELAFRKIEREAFLSLLNHQNNSIIALGGGTPCYFSNMTDLVLSKQNSVYVKASIPTLVKRLWKEKVNRPLISHVKNEALLAEFIGKHLFERSSFYQKAKHTVLVDDRSIEEVVTEISLKLA